MLLVDAPIDVVYKAITEQEGLAAWWTFETIATPEVGSIAEFKFGDRYLNKMKVFWTKNAINHLADIYEYIAFNLSTYARHMIDRITRRTEQIAEHNLSGRKVRSMMLKISEN